MKHYDYQKTLKETWKSALAKYEAGNREPESYFETETIAELSSIGLNTMDVYDYVEDFVSGGDPDFETFLMICEARRDFFLTVQEGVLSPQTLDSTTLPAKDSELAGIIWLPRIIAKAKSKLRGELPSDTMYGCGGDRRFLKTNNIHPAEFLRAVWAYEDEIDKLVEWVQSRKSS